MNDLRRLLSHCVFVSLLPLAAGAQTATLVRDISQGEGHSVVFGNAHAAGSVPGHAFFVATAGYENSEMWTSDGTAEGTFVLKDVCPGPCGSEARVLGSVKGALFWAGLSSDHRYHLWRSDGTRAGTYRVVDELIRFNGDFSFNEPVPISSVAGGFLYFMSTGSTEVLWRTDGTRAGTQRVHTFDAGQTVETLLTDAGKIFLLVTQRPLSGSGDTVWSVWASDGTAQGTRSIKVLDHIRVWVPQVAGGHLFFVARDSTPSYEVWASDGTEAGTRAVTDFAAPYPFGNYSSPDFHSWVSGGRLLFVADDVIHGEELYASDGSVAGTRRITDFGTAEPRFGSVADLGRVTVFTADDDLGHAGVWTTAGDPASTRFLPLSCGSDCWEEISGFVKVGPRVVLFVQASSGIKILSTDGTPAGTRLLRDGCPNDCGVMLPENLPAESAALPFATWPDTLWVTDGTPSGTRKRGILRDGSIPDSYFEIPAGSFTLVFASYRDTSAFWALGPGQDEPRLVATSSKAGPDTYVDNLTDFQNGLAFTVCGEDTFSLWRSEGTEASTMPAADLSDQPCSADSGNMARLGTNLVFLQEDSSRDQALWRSDGMPGGTLQLTPGGLEVRGALAVGAGRVYFSARYDQTSSVWTSDGTPAGTLQLASWPASEKSPYSLAAVGNELYFYLSLGAGFDTQLWKSDGRPQGTKKVFDQGGVNNRPASFTRLGSAVYFVSRGTGYDEAVWRTDGTTAGTRALGTVAGMRSEAYPHELFAFQGSLYFFAWAEHAGRGLWRSDGTAAGTVLLAEFPEPGNSAYPAEHQPTAAGGKLFFVAQDDQHGLELWVTDGTPAGTRMVRDIALGAASSQPDHLAAAGGRLFFSASEETYGRELWVSDGTEAGTHLVQDVNPFGASSEPDRLTVAGNRLYFTADDGISGRELWSLPLSGPAGCRPSSSRLCLSGGRYQVEASWRIDNLSGHGTASPLSGDTGTFWFFDPANVEAVVKVLDGQGINGHVWVFYGALSNVDYTLTVTDTQTGATRRYHNPAGRLASVGDTKAFGPLGAYGAAPPVAETIETPPSPLPRITGRAGRAATALCAPGARRLCLNNNRFAVEVTWKDFQGHTGPGTAVPLTGDTGTFWFFDAANVELVVKVLDGRPVNNKLWVFYGALSNVEYTVTVTDTQTGTVRTYKNPSGQFASVADTNAF